MAAEILPPEMARNAAVKFLKGIFFRGEINVDTVTLESAGEPPAYRIGGTITMKSRNPLLGRLLYQEAPPDTFQLRVDAIEGTVLDYEVK